MRSKGCKLEQAQTDGNPTLLLKSLYQERRGEERRRVMGRGGEEKKQEKRKKKAKEKGKEGGRVEELTSGLLYISIFLKNKQICIIFVIFL